MLRAVGGEQQQLGERRGRIFYFENKRADSLSENGSARFARRDDIKALRCKSVGKQAKLRGFAASVQAFKSQKNPAQYSIIAGEKGFRKLPARGLFFARRSRWSLFKSRSLTALRRFAGSSAIMRNGRDGMFEN